MSYGFSYYILYLYLPPIKLPPIKSFVVPPVKLTPVYSSVYSSISINVFSNASFKGVIYCCV